MRRAFWLRKAPLLALLFASVTLLAADSVREAEARRVAVVAKARPTVVCVFSPGGQGGGSGVVIDTEGYALTNYHVVEGSGPVMQCGLADGILYDAVLVGLDRVGDVALIKLLPKEKGKPFLAATLADSDKVQAGDWSFAMGNPFLLATDYTPTVTFGLVSGVHRYQYPAGTFLEYTDCIQIDTSINPGNSGGPLFNADGELIGINGRGSFDKRGRVNSGVGYAISINQIKNFLGHLYAGIDTDHATLGATVKTHEGEEGESARIQVQTILDDSDAARRGLQPEDELVEFAGRPIASVNQYKNVLGIYPKGWRIPLVYRRENRKKEILVRLQGLMPKEATQLPKDKERPSPRPRGERPKSNSEAAKMYKAKSGYANAFFNDLARDKLLELAKKRGDFTALTGKWSIEGDMERKAGKTPVRIEIGEKPDAEGQGTHTSVSIDLGGVTFALDPLRANPDPRELRDPPGSGGLLMALYHYHRLLVLGKKGFEGDFAHAGHEPLYPPSVAAPRLADRRVDCAVLATEHAAVKAKWFFSRDDAATLAGEVSLAKDEDPCELHFSDYRAIDGRQLPHRIEVRSGDDTFGTIIVKAYQLPAATEAKP